MRQDAWINIAALAGVLFGLKQANDGQNDNAAADALRTEAKRFHDASCERLEQSCALLAGQVGQLVGLRDACWSNLLVPFALTLGQIRRVEFTPYDTTCEPGPASSWVLPLETTLVRVEPSPMEAGGAAFGAGALVGVSAVGAATLFGRASTGRPIHELRGAARESARDAWLGGGPIAKGGGGRRRGELTPYVASAGAAAAVGGHMFASAAAENLALARQDHARARVVADLLDAQSDHNDRRRQTAEQYRDVVLRLIPRAAEAFGFVRVLIANRGTDYASYDRALGEQLYAAVETVRALKEVLSVRLWSAEGHENPEAHAILEAMMRRLPSPEPT